MANDHFPNSNNSRHSCGDRGGLLAKFTSRLSALVERRCILVPLTDQSKPRSRSSVKLPRSGYQSRFDAPRIRANLSTKRCGEQSVLPELAKRRSSWLGVIFIRFHGKEQGVCA